MRTIAFASLGFMTLLGAIGAGCAQEAGEDTSIDEALIAHCEGKAGDLASKTLPGAPKNIPIKHVIIVTQENRSFDHMLGSLALKRKDVDGIPADYVNFDKKGKAVHFTHRKDTCFDADSPHNEEAMEASIDGNKMDMFVKTAATGKSNGHYVMSYYTDKELPFYYFLANSFSISDRYFASMIGPTDPNRAFMYAATSNGGDEGGKPEKMAGVKTIFDALDAKGVSWGVYSSGMPRQGTSIGWDCAHKGFHKMEDFYKGAKAGNLPAVLFLDPGLGEDEHPPHDVQLGEAYGKKVYDAVRQSSLWSSTALFFTYDEAGGIADHVPPPAACPPRQGLRSFDRYGVRVPLTLVSPYARRGYVSHTTHSHTSLLRFIELINNIPALTDRDANSDAMLDMFDFKQTVVEAPKAPSAGKGACDDDPSGNWFTRHAEIVGENARKAVKCPWNIGDHAE